MYPKHKFHYFKYVDKSNNCLYSPIETTPEGLTYNLPRIYFTIYSLRERKTYNEETVIHEICKS